MKKLLLCLIIFFGKNLYSQPSVYDLEEVGLESSFNSTYDYYNGANYLNSLHTNFKLIDEDQPLRTFEDRDYSFDDYYYDLSVELYGFNNGEDQENANLLKTIPADYLGYLPWYSPGSINIGEEEDYDFYFLKLKVYTFRLTSILQTYAPIGGMYVEESPVFPDMLSSGGSDPDPDPAPTGKPDLVISELKIENTGSGDDYNILDGDTPTLNKNEFTDFTFTVANDGGETANSSKIEVIVSSDPNGYPTPTTTPASSYFTIDAGSLLAGASDEVTVNQYIRDYINNLNLSNGETYYMFAHVNYNNQVEEKSGGQDNNIIRFPFKYSSGRTGTQPIKLQNGTQQYSVENTNKSQASSSILSLYDSQNGNRVIYQSVQPGETINISHLPGTVYAIHLNDVYIKQIHLLKHAGL